MAGDTSVIRTDVTVVDAVVDGIKAKTDQMVFSVPNRVDATATGLGANAGAEIADAVLDRNMATGTDSGSPTVRTVRQALRSLRNKTGIASGVLTVRKEDDATASWTATVTTAAGNPISQIDPA